jgi:glucoamylase
MNTIPEYADIIRRLTDVTKNLIDDCVLENGGIVAANSTKRYFPINAKNYFYIWPRDAAYTCLAANIMGMKDIPKNFFRWCLTHAEGFRTKGLFYEKYYPNGLKALLNFQPDQTGTVLYAVHDYCKFNPQETKDPEILELITLAANGICSSWNGKHFTDITNDLWEERSCFPELEENFTYSLASCIKGLRCANEIIPSVKWLKTSEEMKNRLDVHFDDYYVRSYGKITDKRIDASILGLVYPFEIYNADNPEIINSINEIEKHLVIDGGVYRYEHDEYDGWINDGRQMNKGSGAWPLLNFWLSIYYSIKQDEINAKKYYCWVLSKLKDNLFIPEQIFSNNLQVSVSPLLWSHTMFFLATKHLNLV